MKKEFKDAVFTVNDAKDQFEFQIGDQMAFLEFVTRDNKVYLTHTSVPNALAEQGVGTVLVQKALDYLKNKDAVIMPMCSFVAHFIDNNPEYHSMLSDGYQM